MANNFVTAFWTSRTYKIPFGEKAQDLSQKELGTKVNFLDIISFVFTPPKVSLIYKNQVTKPSKIAVRLKQGEISSIFFNLFINDWPLA